MNVGGLTVVIIVSLMVSLLLGIPVTFCLFGIAALFIAIILGPSQLIILPLTVFGQGVNEVLIAIPLFIFMAAVLERSGMAGAMYSTMYKWFAGLRGGLAIGTVVMCTLLAAMTGISGTGVVMMGLLGYPEMMKRGYSRDIALGCIPGGACLGPIIPPSNIMIIVASFASLSVGKMFMGGLFPGLVMSFFFVSYLGIKSWLRPEVAPAIPIEERATWKEKFISLRGVVLPVILVILVLGSIYSGAATATEAAGVGAFGALVCAAVYRQLTLKNLKGALFLAVKLNAMIMWLVIGGAAFASLLGMTGVRNFIAESLLALPVHPFMVIILLQIIGLIMGMFFDASAIAIITVPIFVPIVVQLGFDPLWFCIAYSVNLVIGFLTPPFGVALFYMKGIVPADVKMSEIYRSVQPYIFLMIIVLIVGLVWPPLFMWLPNMMIK